MYVASEVACIWNFIEIKSHRSVGRDVPISSEYVAEETPSR